MSRFTPETLPEILYAQFQNEHLFNKVINNSMSEGDTYEEMLEKALFLYIEKSQDLNRKLMKYAHRYGPGE